METPQFTGKDKANTNSQSNCPQHILCAPKKNQTKKTLQIKKNMILTSEISNGFRKLDFNNSPALNEFVLMHARIFQDSVPQTPTKTLRETFYGGNNLFEEKESTIIQSNKRKFIERDKQCMVDENESNTEKKCIKLGVRSTYTDIYHEEPGKKLKPLLPFRSSIKFSSKKDNQPVFNLFRDKEVHSNISRFNQNYKMQAVDNDCSSDDDATYDQIKFMTESLVNIVEINESQNDEKTNNY